MNRQATSASSSSAAAKLGEVVDIYSYEVLEEMTAPVDGLPVFPRATRAWWAPARRAFALAEERPHRGWLD